MDSDRNDVLDTLSRIRDNVLLLCLANAYLCDSPFLRRIGRDIDSNLPKLREDIVALKKQFPGRFAVEVETDGLLDELHGKALLLQNPDNETTERCISGDLGRQMESGINALSVAVHTIRDQVEGKTAVVPVAGRQRGACCLRIHPQDIQGI